MLRPWRATAIPCRRRPTRWPRPSGPARSRSCCAPKPACLRSCARAGRPSACAARITRPRSRLLRRRSCRWQHRRPIPPARRARRRRTTCWRILTGRSQPSSTAAPAASGGSPRSLISRARRTAFCVPPPCRMMPSGTRSCARCTSSASRAARAAARRPRSRSWSGRARSSSTATQCITSCWHRMPPCSRRSTPVFRVQ